MLQVVFHLSVLAVLALLVSRVIFLYRQPIVLPVPQVAPWEPVLRELQLIWYFVWGACLLVGSMSVWNADRLYTLPTQVVGVIAAFVCALAPAIMRIVQLYNLNLTEFEVQEAQRQARWQLYWSVLIAATLLLESVLALCFSLFASAFKLKFGWWMIGDLAVIGLLVFVLIAGCLSYLATSLFVAGKIRKIDWPGMQIISILGKPAVELNSGMYVIVGQAFGQQFDALESEVIIGNKLQAREELIKGGQGLEEAVKNLSTPELQTRGSVDGIFIVQKENDPGGATLQFFYDFYFQNISPLPWKLLDPDQRKRLVGSCRVFIDGFFEQAVKKLDYRFLLTLEGDIVMYADIQKLASVLDFYLKSQKKSIEECWRLFRAGSNALPVGTPLPPDCSTWPAIKPILGPVINGSDIDRLDQKHDYAAIRRLFLTRGNQDVYGNSVVAKILRGLGVYLSGFAVRDRNEDPIVQAARARVKEASVVASAQQPLADQNLRFVAALRGYDLEQLKKDVSQNTDVPRRVEASAKLEQVFQDSMRVFETRLTAETLSKLAGEGRLNVVSGGDFLKQLASLVGSKGNGASNN